MWIANAGEDSVSKWDTTNNKELARYHTWFDSYTHGAWEGAAPSRTAVDSQGNVYVANRAYQQMRVFYHQLHGREAKIAGDADDLFPKCRVNYNGREIENEQ
jgi:DNA-binding beta-propeller fold protein YncE